MMPALDRIAKPPHPLEPTYQIVLQNHLEALEDAQQWINDIVNKLQVSERSCFRLQLIVEEILTNIIQNAYLDNQRHEIHLKLTTDDQSRLTLQIIDDGLSFDPVHYLPSPLPKTLATAEHGGMGLQLVRHFADECQYERVSNLNCLTILIQDKA